MRYNILIFVLVCLTPGLSFAGWTGIGLTTAQEDMDWEFGGGNRLADVHRLGLHVEDGTQYGLRVGVNAGYFSVRLRDPLNVFNAEKYEGEFLSFYLRWPYQLSDVFSLHGQLQHQFNNGSDPLDSEDSSIDWDETELTLGLSMRLGLFSLRPFVSWRSIDGDTSSESSTVFFENKNRRSSGVVLDIYVEPTAFVRLKGTYTDDSSLWLGFIREY